MKRVQLGTGLSSPLRLCPHCSLWGELCISLHPHPKGQQVGGECRTCPQG